jgi:2-polyprenyl-3-methyl-5-hydroxy-6-metoxy-1,4-benzoquinol methylase
VEEPPFPDKLELMSLASEYQRQYGWRDWPKVFDALPSLDRKTIFDLGCGVGDVAAALVARGAQVVGSWRVCHGSDRRL